jgi:hypothetical protein
LHKLVGARRWAWTLARMTRNPAEPKGKWVPWLRFFLLFVSLPVAVFEASLIQDPSLRSGFVVMAIASLGISLLLHKPIQQRFEVDIDGRPVQIELETNAFGTVRMQWSGGSERGAMNLGRYWGISEWFEPRIVIAGISRRMLIYISQRGFLISNGLEPYAFSIRENTMHF